MCNHIVVVQWTHLLFSHVCETHISQYCDPGKVRGHTQYVQHSED